MLKESPYTARWLFSLLMMPTHCLFDLLSVKITMPFALFLRKSLQIKEFIFIFAVEIGEKSDFIDALAYYFALD